ncbi:MAG: beta strand repeat-containing protein, partial [Cellvibrionaceae bacterium]
IGWSNAGIIEHMTSDKDSKHLGGSDTLSLADGHHWVIGGFGLDSITAGTGNDIVLGDNGVASFTAGVLTRLESSDADDTTGGNDIINLGNGNTDIIGGAGTDTITTGNGVDRVLGDHGFMGYHTDGTLVDMTSTLSTFGADDFITLFDGDAAVIGGTGADTISVARGNSQVIGDQGYLRSSDNGIITEASSTHIGDGGNDIINLAQGNALVIAGFGADQVTAGSGNDIVIGDNGTATYTAGVLTNITSSDLDDTTGAADILLLGDGNTNVIGGVGGDRIETGSGIDRVVGDHGSMSYHTDGTLIEITTRLPMLGGDDTISLFDGDAAVIGGTGRDTISVARGNSQVLGDQGYIHWDNAGVITEAISTDIDKGDDDIINIGQGDTLVIAGFGADQVTAGTGNDIVIGDNGEAKFTAGILTSIKSTDLDDTTGGNDLLNLGDGNTHVIAGVGEDNVTTGLGSDRVVGDHGSMSFHTDGTLTEIISTLPMLGAADTITLFDGDTAVIGGTGNDAITATEGADFVLGDQGYIQWDNAGIITQAISTDLDKGGDDTISLGNGDTLVIAGFGADQITTQTGKDIVIGDNGEATFTAGVLTLLTSTDLDDATGAGDIIILGDGDTDVIAGAGQDRVETGTGLDQILGDHGTLSYADNGTLTEMLSRLPLLGDDDTILVHGGGSAVIAGGGRDQITATGSFRDAVLGDHGVINWTQDGVIEKAESTDLTIGDDDQIDLADGDNIAIAGQGNDQVTTGTEDDIVLGDNGVALFSNGHLVKLLSTDSSDLTGGNDIIVAGAGYNRMISGTGDDQITALAGDDHVISDHGQMLYNEADILLIAESLLPDQGGNDQVDLGDGHNRVIAGQGNDEVITTFGDDHIIGDNGFLSYTQTGVIVEAAMTDIEHGGDDVLSAGDGDNIVLGGFGSDNIETGAGDDTVISDNGVVLFENGFRSDVRSTDTSEATGGNDIVSLGAGNDQAIAGVGSDEVTMSAGENNVLGDNGSITSDAEGRYLQMTTGETDLGGKDRLIGGSGRDNLFGGVDEDYIEGNDGNDLLSGDGAMVTRQPELDQILFETIDLFLGGDDEIDGGEGNDYMFGGFGSDLFYGDTSFDVFIGEYARATISTLLEEGDRQVSLVTLAQGLDTLRGDGDGLYEVPTGTADSFISYNVDSIKGFVLSDPSVLAALQSSGSSADLISELNERDRNGERRAGIDLVLPTAPTAAGGEESEEEGEVEGGAELVGDECATSDGSSDQDLVEGDATSAESDQATECQAEESKEEVEEPVNSEASEDDLHEVKDVDLTSSASAMIGGSLAWKLVSTIKAKTGKVDRSGLEALGRKASRSRFKAWDKFGR